MSGQPVIQFLDKDPIAPLEAFVELLSWTENDWLAAFSEIGVADKESQDLLHEMELSSLNVVEGYKVMKQMQIVRRRRRVMKDFKELMEPLYNFAIANKDIVKSLRRVMVQMVRVQESHQNRRYRPRVRTDLKFVRQQQACDDAVYVDDDDGVIES